MENLVQKLRKAFRNIFVAEAIGKEKELGFNCGYSFFLLSTPNEKLTPEQKNDKEKILNYLKEQGFEDESF